ncbi:Stomatin [Brachionus plicatilis]|uniref:Stomatin n=1 Tax=Brachionus plicatilis TaxID=10195 RepID=A0A3M7T2K4_BRAPC|nr:Stomatin [Brachionus plicatilis]
MDNSDDHFDSHFYANSPKRATNLSPNGSRFRQMMHRPSVRSISEMPNIIGVQPSENKHDICTYVLCALSWLSVIIFFPFSLPWIFRVVKEYERAVIFRLGCLKKSPAGPGILPCIESVTKVDIRTVSFDVAPQEVLTKDSVTVSVDAVVYYRVFNPAVSVANVENAQESTRLLAQTSLRNVLGQKSLSEILSDRESVSRALRECLDEATDPWGIEVERVEFKDVRLPVQLQRAMATEAEATREARAKVIMAEGEQRAAKAIKGAADIISTSRTAIQIRYLQTLSSIASEKNSTIIFPIPIEILDSLKGSDNKNK